MVTHVHACCTRFLLCCVAQDDIKTKIEKIVRGVYGGSGATYSEAAEGRIRQYEMDASIRVLPVCMSKTQYSLSDDATKLGAPRGFQVHAEDIYVSACN